MEEDLYNVQIYNKMTVPTGCDKFILEFGSPSVELNFPSNSKSDVSVNSDSFSEFKNDDLEDDLTSCSESSDYINSSLSNVSTDNNDSSVVNIDDDVDSDYKKFNHDDKLFINDFDLSKEIGVEVYDIAEMKSVVSFAKYRIDSGLETDAFIITNLGSVVNQFHLWKSELPMVQPFYAVKCLPDIAVLKLLASLGCSFDCATQGEIDLVLNGLGDDLNLSSRGIASTSVVYANPAKMVNMLKYAIDNDVRMTVFDGEDELYKIAAVPGHENLQLLLRITTDDKASICQFSKKFGCPVLETPKLLKLAMKLGLNVAGVCFHVGSGCGDSNAYVTALKHTRFVFDAAESIGLKPLTVIDIGGGFPGETGGYGGPNMPTFQDLAAAVRRGLDDFAKNFNRSMSELTIIAEPGRFFVSASTSVATKVYSRKGGNANSQALYVDDGVYGTFNNIVYDHATPVPMKLTSFNKMEYADCGISTDEVLLPTIIFGPTCDGLDQLCSLDTTRLPRCDVNDWIFWDNMGAYTHTASFVFNGYTHVPKRCYCYL